MADPELQPTHRGEYTRAAPGQRGCSGPAAAGAGPCPVEGAAGADGHHRRDIRQGIRVRSLLRVSQRCAHRRSYPGC